ncbi:MAG: serine/threonine protein kinase [Deltaproteobacteria bacterium]|nr:serine/threonine protein kinase [Deltaproteobacteria bacterium]
MHAGCPLQAGDLIAGWYVVERVLGAGGMAYVALAAHTEQRHRVAIKVLRPENSRRTEVVKRFEREQRTLTMLHSEHTLRIYGFGQHDGLPYMLLEYLQGRDLDEHLKADGPLPVERAVEYILQACHALAEAHLLGVVHRDLKPGNLFLTRRTDGSPCIKVLDFGISKVSHEVDSLAEPSLVTKAHAVMGSPFYMSPEQMLSSTNVDSRSDIWALGVTLYELLTKSLPFAADSATAVCRRIMGDEPTPLRKLRPSYPVGLEEILTRCLQKRPERRFGNVADLAVRLGEFGPPHARYAIQAICDLIPPTDPFDPDESTMRTRTVALPTGAPEGDGATTGEASSSAETVYLPHGTEVGRSARVATLVGASLLSFGLGLGVGWLLNLDTDPTKGQPAGQPTARPSLPPPPQDPQPTSPTASANTAADPAIAAASSEASPIDLDGGSKVSKADAAEDATIATASKPRPSKGASSVAEASAPPSPPPPPPAPQAPPAASVKGPNVPNVTF